MERIVTRIGIIGFGFIGAGLYTHVRADPTLGMEIAFVHNRSAARLNAVPVELRTDSLEGMLARRADLIVEVAHPDFTRQHGARFLENADYLPVSVSAFADAALLERLRSAAAQSGRRLYIPHGALVGLDTLAEYRDSWRAVAITFIKNPAHIDFSESGFDPATIRGETVVYDGPVRGIAARFPRNVNTMVTCAIATVGVDRCHARLIAIPHQLTGVLEVVAQGHDGSVVTLRREQPMAGVSGTEMLASTLASVLSAAQRRGHAPVEFV